METIIGLSASIVNVEIITQEVESFITETMLRAIHYIIVLEELSERLSLKICI